MTTTNERTTAKQPAPSRMDRDANGRLTGLCFDSGKPFPAQGTRWLVAVDGSDHSLHAVAQAVRLAEQIKDSSLDLVNVQHWLSREGAEAELGNRGWKAAEKACVLLAETRIPWQMHITMGEAAETIVALSARLGCQTIVLGSRGLSATENLLIGSVAYKIIHLSPTSVLLVR